MLLFSSISHAWSALHSIDAGDKIGTILPCNVMLQEVCNEIEVAIINPRTMVSEIEDE